MVASDGQRYWYPDSDIRLPPTEQDRIAEIVAKDKIIAEKCAQIWDLEQRLVVVVAKCDAAEKKLSHVMSIVKS